ncbi:hypothetical protein LPJ71_002990, partial [Coemansia sp. S17]
VSRESRVGLIARILRWTTRTLRTCLWSLVQPYSSRRCLTMFGCGGCRLLLRARQNKMC